MKAALLFYILLLSACYHLEKSNEWSNLIPTGPGAYTFAVLGEAVCQLEEKEAEAARIAELERWLSYNGVTNYEIIDRRSVWYGRDYDVRYKHVYYDIRAK